MLWPDTLTVEGIAAETRVLDVAVGFKRSNTCRNTGVRNINLLGTDFLDNLSCGWSHLSGSKGAASLSQQPTNKGSAQFGASVSVCGLLLLS